MYVGLDGSDPSVLDLPNIWKDAILYISLVVAYFGTMHGSHTVPYSLSATLLCHALGLLQILTLVARSYLAFVSLSCCIYSRCRVATPKIMIGNGTVSTVIFLRLVLSQRVDVLCFGHGALQAGFG